jgi:hypothetical protein
MKSNETTLAMILGLAGVGVAVAMVAASKRTHPEDPYLKHEREQAEAQARKAAAAPTNDVTDFGGRA